MSEAASGHLRGGQKKKSGQQMGRENVEALREYIKGLKMQGRRVPSRHSQPNKSAIALACGFRRQVFETNEEVAKLLEQAVKHIGLEAGAPARTGRDAHVQRRLDSSDHRNKELEERLAIKTVEVEKLKQEKKDLEERLRNYEVFEEVMMTTGRRFIP